MSNINVKIEVFEGPFDLLYHLIEKNEIDIYDIPISELADQYLEYMEKMETNDMESMSEFLLMAATLLEIKSKMLLPKPKNENDEDEIDPREELVAKLLEYKRFKNITGEFKQREEDASFVLYKEANEKLLAFKEEDLPADIEEFLDGITFEDIYNAFEEVMKRKEMKIDRVRSSFRSVERDMFTVEEKMEFIKDLLILNPKVNFKSIFREESDKMEIVVTFLALLELIKIKSVKIKQDKLFEEIVITNYNGSDIYES